MSHRLAAFNLAREGTVGHKLVVELDTEGDYEDKGVGRSPSKIEAEKGPGRGEGGDEIDGGMENSSVNPNKDHVECN